MEVLRPIHAGFINPSGEPDAYEPQRREPLHLFPEHLVGHLHGIGSTRSGKTKWLEYFCRGLYRQGVGFTLIDPQGELSESLVSYLAYVIPDRPVIYFDPSSTEVVVPFNPFRPLARRPGERESDYLSRVSVRTEKQSESVLRAWNAESTDETPRLGRWLYCVLYPVALGITTFNEIYNAFSLGGKTFRALIARGLEGHKEVQTEWLNLNATTRLVEFNAEIESIKNRLLRFVSNANIRRMLSVTSGALDMAEVLDAHGILIVNLKDSELISRRDANVLGTLFINELWAAARSRSLEQEEWREPYFLLIDEAERFVTPDIRDILDQGSGKGLRLGLFHQHLAQFRAAADTQTYHSVMTNAKTKCVFGGLGYDDALEMVRELFAGQIDYAEIKFVLEQTKFWPVYTRDTVYSSGRGGANVTGRHSTVATAAGAFVGERWDPSLLIGGAYVPATQGASDSESSASGSSSAEVESWQEGVADIPIFYPVPYREPTSVSHYSLDEQYDRLVAQLKEQFQRHFFIKRPGEKTVPAITPYVETFKISPETERSVVLKRFLEPHGLLPADIDGELARQAREFEAATTLEADPESYRS